MCLIAPWVLHKCFHFISFSQITILAVVWDVSHRQCLCIKWAIGGIEFRIYCWLSWETGAIVSDSMQDLWLQLKHIESYSNPLGNTFSSHTVLWLPPHLIQARLCPFLYITQSLSCWPSSSSCTLNLWWSWRLSGFRSLSPHAQTIWLSSS